MVQEGDETYAKLDGHGEEVAADRLRDVGTARDAGKVDEAGLDKALGALDGLEELLSEAEKKYKHQFLCSFRILSAYTTHR